MSLTVLTRRLRVRLQLLVPGGLGVDGVGVLAMGIEILTSGRDSLAMGVGVLLKPGGLGGLDLGLGLGGARPGRSLFGDRLALLDPVRFWSISSRMCSACTWRRWLRALRASNATTPMTTMAAPTAMTIQIMVLSMSTPSMSVGWSE